MDVDALLRSARLPDVPVDTEIALHNALRRGTIRQRPRRIARYVAIGVLALIALAILALTFLTLSGGWTGRLPFFDTTERARWEVEPEALPTVDSTSIAIRVNQTSCNDGNTNPPHQPKIDLSKEEISISVRVDAPTPVAHTCPGGFGVPLVVDLGEPVGERTLVDGYACANASHNPECSGVRWKPAGAGGVPVSGHALHLGGDGRMEQQSGLVQLFDQSGQLVTSVTTDDQGRFELRVPNGSFNIALVPPARADGTKPVCGEPLPITVVGLAIEEYQLVCGL